MNTLRRDLPVVLVGSDAPNEGRVQINHEGRQGTVCDDNWDDKDATVVCRMLGYTDGIALQGSSFGSGTGDILLDEVACTGNEKNLFDCKHAGIGVNDCKHTEDAGVRCYELYSKNTHEEYNTTNIPNYDYYYYYKV